MHKTHTDTHTALGNYSLNSKLQFDWYLYMQSVVLHSFHLFAQDYTKGWRWVHATRTSSSRNKQTGCVLWCSTRLTLSYCNYSRPQWTVHARAHRARPCPRFDCWSADLLLRLTILLFSLFPYFTFFCILIDPYRFTQHVTRFLINLLTIMSIFYLYSVFNQTAHFCCTNLIPSWTGMLSQGVPDYPWIGIEL